ncbi:7917_t:CDS:2, partial [Gigaspora margarita]
NRNAEVNAAGQCVIFPHNKHLPDELRILLVIRLGAFGYWLIILVFPGLNLQHSPNGLDSRGFYFCNNNGSKFLVSLRLRPLLAVRRA